MRHGIEGYVVQVSLPDATTNERLVAKADLQSFIEQSITEHCAIVRIEPKRKDMEAFFLEMVGEDQPNETRS